MATSGRMTPTAPVHTEVQSDEFYDGIDPGIRFAVRVLHARGIPTCQSCEGGEGHAYEYPSVDMVDARAFEALEVLHAHGITVRDVSSVWLIQDGAPTERVWRVTLRDKLTEREHERPMFIAGHLHRDRWEATA